MKNIDKSIFKFLLAHKCNAVAHIRGGKDFPQIDGLVEFFQLPSGFFVVCEVTNLPQTATNIFAFHIHEGESCEQDFLQTGNHFNPENFPHPNHAGDMPPLFSNEGNAWQAFFTDRTDFENILGKTVVIHDSFDDFSTQPSGNSGKKIACGKIERTK